MQVLSFENDSVPSSVDLHLSFTAALAHQNLPARLTPSGAALDSPLIRAGRIELAAAVQANDAVNTRFVLNNKFPQGLQNYEWSGEMLLRAARSAVNDNPLMVNLLLEKGAVKNSVGFVRAVAHSYARNNRAIMSALTQGHMSISGANIISAAYSIIRSQSPQDMAAFLMRFPHLDMQDDLGKALLRYADRYTSEAQNQTDYSLRYRVADLIRGRVDLADGSDKD